MRPYLGIIISVTAWAAVALGLIAAWLWYKSTASVLYDPAEAKRDHDLVNIFATVEAQSKWNRRAAIATALSLVCQATASALQHFVQQ